MRLDKYLKVARIIKRRTIANEACDAGKILVNGKVAKASYNVNVGDKIEVQMGSKRIAIEVMKICEYIKKEDAESMFKVIS